MGINEDEIRRRIRENLKRQEEQRQNNLQRHQQYHEVTADEETVRRIQREEEREFYKHSQDHHEYVNEVGEIEFLTMAEIREREGYFDYEEQVENIDREKRNILTKLIVGGVIILLALGALFYYMQPDVGSLAVVSNIKGAEIVLDGQSTGYTTDALLEELSTGEHLVTLKMSGYLMQSTRITRVMIHRNQETRILLQMTPIDTNSAGTSGQP